MSNSRAGVSSTVITPSDSMWMAGYAARREPSAGAESNLFAKALALEDETGGKIVVLACDLIAMPKEIADVVSREVHRRHGLSRERLLLTSSHTHCGPEVRPSKVPFFRIPTEYAKKIEGYVEQLQKKLIEVINAALDDLKPADLTVHQTQATFAHNRRGAEFVDHAVPVLCAWDENEKPRAVLFGYACHNTTLRPDFRRFCGDYAGFAQQYLEETLPGTRALFMPGAGADQNPEPLGTVDAAQQHGRELADAIRSAVAADGKIVTGRFQAAMEQVLLDFQPLPSKAELERQLASDDQPVRTKAEFLLNSQAQGGQFEKQYLCPLQVIRLGEELLLIAIGGEPVIDYALTFKRDFAGPMVWVVGYANDMFGYVPTARVQREGGYEGGRATLWSALPMPFTDSVEQRLKQAAHRLVMRVSQHGDESKVKT